MKKLLIVTTSPLMAVLTAVGLFVAMWGTPEAPYSQPGFDQIPELKTLSS